MTKVFHAINSTLVRKGREAIPVVIAARVTRTAQTTSTTLTTRST